MEVLNSLTSLVKKRKRVGRGGDLGGTSGRGHKGQKARSGGGVKPYYEGGQMPLVRRLPKRGFNNTRFKTVYTVIGLDRLQQLFDDGELVNKQALVERNVIKKIDVPVKILGGASFSKRLIVHADAFSSSARELIQQMGGEIHILAKER